MKIRNCDVDIWYFYEIDDGTGDIDLCTVSKFRDISLFEGYKMMAEYMEKYPDGWADGSDCGAYHYYVDGVEYCIGIRTDRQEREARKALEA